MTSAADELIKANDPQGGEVGDRVKVFREQWDQLEKIVQNRIRLAQTYVAFHKKAQQVLLTSFKSDYYSHVQSRLIQCVQCLTTYIMYRIFVSPYRYSTILYIASICFIIIIDHDMQKAPPIFNLHQQFDRHLILVPPQHICWALVLI